MGLHSFTVKIAIILIHSGLASRCKWLVRLYLVVLHLDLAGLEQCIPKPAPLIAVHLYCAPVEGNSLQSAWARRRLSESAVGSEVMRHLRSVPP